MGRQPLDFGSQRLIGSDEEWFNIPRAFDAGNLSVAVGSGKLHLFAGGMVEPRHDRWDGWYGPQHLTGAYGEFGNAERGFALEPFALWKSRPVFDEAGDPEPLRILSSGFHSMGNLPRRFDYDVEMALQTGSAGHLPARSWAGSWELGYQMVEDDRSPHAALSYKYASGSTRSDRWSTFDDLYPAGFNSCGLLDPFAWRNLKDLGVVVEWPVAPRWQIGMEHHSYWLATTRDGLYLDGGPAWITNPAAASSRVGSQFNSMVQFQPWQRMSFGAGVARLFAGPFLAENGLPAHPTTFFVRWKLVL